MRFVFGLLIGFTALVPISYLVFFALDGHFSLGIFYGICASAMPCAVILMLCSIFASIFEVSGSSSILRRYSI